MGKLEVQHMLHSRRGIVEPSPGEPEQGPPEHARLSVQRHPRIGILCWAALEAGAVSLVPYPVGPGSSVTLQLVIAHSRVQSKEDHARLGTDTAKIPDIGIRVVGEVYRTLTCALIARHPLVELADQVVLTGDPSDEDGVPEIGNIRAEPNRQSLQRPYLSVSYRTPLDKEGRPFSIHIPRNTSMLFG